jgi:hypothetical protein
MIEPKRAPVKPRVYSPHTGDVIPLEDEIRELLEVNSFGQIWIVGPPGSGKTIALGHLAAVFSPSFSKINLVDSPVCDKVRNPSVLSICTAMNAGPGISRHFRLAPWTTDCLIEYLLCNHKEQCASVVGRLKSALDKDSLLGNPELWEIILRQMASDESILDVRSALLDFLDEKFPEFETRKLMQAHCLALLMDAEQLAAQSLAEIKKRDISEPVLRIIRHRCIQILLAGEQIATDLAAKSPHLQLDRQLPIDLVREVANQIQSDSKCVETLKKILSESKTECHAMAASILHRVDSTWTPGAAIL